MRFPEKTRGCNKIGPLSASERMPIFLCQKEKRGPERPLLYSYKRILRRGKEAVYKELLFLAFGFDIRKLHNRIQGDRLTKRFLQETDKEKAF